MINNTVNNLVVCKKSTEHVLIQKQQCCNCYHKMAVEKHFKIFYSLHLVYAHFRVLYCFKCLRFPYFVSPSLHDKESVL